MLGWHRAVVSLELLVPRRAPLRDVADAFSEAERRTGLEVIVTP